MPCPYFHGIQLYKIQFQPRLCLRHHPGSLLCSPRPWLYIICPLLFTIIYTAVQPLWTVQKHQWNTYFFGSQILQKWILVQAPSWLRIPPLHFPPLLISLASSIPILLSVLDRQASDNNTDYTNAIRHINFNQTHCNGLNFRSIDC